MDPERTYLRVHARVSGMLSQLLTPRIRMALEYAYLAVAVALFCLLVIMHTNFVQQPGCSGELSAVEFTEAQLIQIKITGAGLWAQNLAEPESVYFQEGVSSETSKVPEMNGDGITIFSPKFWLNWLGSGSRKSKFIFKSWKNEKEFLEPQMEKAFGSSIGVSAYDSEVKAEAKDLHTEQPLSVREAFKEALFLLCTRLKSPIISFYSSANQFSNDARMLWKRARWSTFLEILKSFQLLRFEHLKTSTVQWLEKRSKAFEPTYLYTVEKGYFLLPEGAKTRHNIRTINVTLSAQNACFGNRWQQLLINTFVGYDTILMNSLINFPRHGYLYNFKTKEFYDLTYGQESSEGPRFGDYFVTKCGVLIMSLFVFFTTTMSVSFTLRETQSRMLKFTVQLEHHARNHLPTFQLIFVHVIESLVFVPIMIGVLFFLFAFYDDQLLAFLVLTLVWLCELFTMISVRTAISMQFFPRFFLLYFLVFHIYFFSYAYGFSYLAFSATAAFMQHLILYFWNRFEVPALQRFMRARAQLQHQAGVQITAPTMYTPTLHVAGAAMPELGVPNPHLVNNVFASGPEAPPRANSATGSDRTLPYQGPEPSEVPDSNSQQAATATVSSSLNTFGSLLFWILGGVSSDSLFSFFSMFRDIRDHGQVHADQPRQGNERPT